MGAPVSKVGSLLLFVYGRQSVDVLLLPSIAIECLITVGGVSPKLLIAFCESLLPAFCWLLPHWFGYAVI